MVIEVGDELENFMWWLEEEIILGRRVLYGLVFCLRLIYRLKIVLVCNYMNLILNVFLNGIFCNFIILNFLKKGKMKDG